MQRRRFITSLGASAVAVCAGCLGGCIKTGPDPLHPSGQQEGQGQGQGQGQGSSALVTINLSDNLVGQWDSVQQNNITVIRIADGNFATSFIAFSSICTHQGCTLIFESDLREFVCPCHGSVFSLNGEVLQGPARVALASYLVTVDQDTLEVNA